MRECSQEVRLITAPTPQEYRKDHGALYQQCYSRLREAKCGNIKCKEARLCARDIENAVERAINKRMKLKTLRGSAHSKVKALIGAINNARASLKAVGEEHQLFRNRVMTPSRELKD